MKKCSNIDEIIEYIQRKHRLVNSRSAGVHAFKMLRKPSGRRILFEEIHGWRIFKHKVFDETSMTIETLATGLQFKGHKEVRASSKLYLDDLVVINVYDHCAEFFTGSSIDFAYVESDYAAEIELLSEWINNDPGVLRAQWLTPNDDYNRILDEISTGGRQIELSEGNPRFINMGAQT